MADQGDLAYALERSAPTAVARASARSERLPDSLIAITVVLSLWVAAGGLAQALIGGLGEEPARRLVIGVAMVLASGLAILERHRLTDQLRARPWLVVPLGAVQVGLATADGLVGSPFVAWSLTCTGLAVVATRARTVWLCVAVSATVYTAGVLVEQDLAALAADGALAGAIGALLAYPVTALVLMGLRGRFVRFVTDVEPMVADIRGGSAAVTAALEVELRRQLRRLPAPAVTLTPVEQRVVEGLAEGLAPKQLAHEWDVSLSTVRTHIRHAKRKTGARTLRQLAALTADRRWPQVCP